MAKKHDIFPLIWKSQFSITKETIGALIKELNDELRYQSTVVLPRTVGINQRQTLKSIQQLRERRDELVKMYIKSYDDHRHPRSGTEIDMPSEAAEVTPDADKHWGVQTEESVRASVGKSFRKTVTTKMDELKSLYQRAWGSTMGLQDLEKMSETEVDENIGALKAIFDDLR